MKARVLWMILAALAILGIVIVRYRGGTNPMHIDPHAADEIEKARRR
jgi:hypothetical protein